MAFAMSFKTVDGGNIPVAEKFREPIKLFRKE
jgi:hypothetical protein